MDIKILLDTLRLEKIDDSVYFSNKYKNYLSNSRLNLIDPNKEGNFEKFVEGFKPFFSSSLALGSAVHELTLQKDLFEIVESVNKPTAKVGLIADKLYPIFKDRDVTIEDICEAAVAVDYYKGLLNENQVNNVLEKCRPYWHQRREYEQSYTSDKELIYLDEKTRQTACECIKALDNNRSVQKLLHPKGILEEVISENEQAILLDVEVNVPEYDANFIIKLKAKLDNYTIDKENNTITVNDVKTLGRIVSEFDKNVSAFSYNREIAFYSFLLSLCAKKYYGMDNPTIKGNYLVVSTIPKYYTKVVPMTKSMYYEGWKQFTTLFKLVAENIAKEHSDFGVWIQKRIIRESKYLQKAH